MMRPMIAAALILIAREPDTPYVWDQAGGVLVTHNEGLRCSSDSPSSVIRNPGSRALLFSCVEWRPEVQAG